MSEQTAEQRVREKWEHPVCHGSPGAWNVQLFGCTGEMRLLSRGKTKLDAWKAALAYTKEHAEKIRQLEEQIEYEKMARSIYRPSELGFLAHWSTLRMLESQLTDLRKGWKG